MTEILLIFLISVVASAVQTVVGFGYIIFAMALFPLFLPVGQCLVLAQLGGLFMSLWLIWGKLDQVEWKKVLWPALFASLGGIAGLLFLRSITGAVYMKILGVILILLAAWMMKFSSLVKIRPTVVNGVIVGTVGGLMGALFGVSAPALVLYYTSNADSKENYTACLQMTMIIQTAVCLLGRAGLGMWPEGVWPLCLPAFAGIFLGKFPGRALYGRLDLRTFKIVVYAFIAIFGIYIFFSN